LPATDFHVDCKHDFLDDLDPVPIWAVEYLLDSIPDTFLPSPQQGSIMAGFGKSNSIDIFSSMTWRCQETWPKVGQLAQEIDGIVTLITLFP
jgi:hypothetical protein